MLLNDTAERSSITVLGFPQQGFIAHGFRPAVRMPYALFTLSCLLGERFSLTWRSRWDAEREHPSEALACPGRGHQAEAEPSGPPDPMAFLSQEVGPLPMEPKPIVQLNHGDGLGSSFEEACACAVRLRA